MPFKTLKNSSQSVVVVVIVIVLAVIVIVVVVVVVVVVVIVVALTVTTTTLISCSDVLSHLARPFSYFFLTLQLPQYFSYLLHAARFQNGHFSSSYFVALTITKSVKLCYLLQQVLQKAISKM
jgi:hypothetical protein